MQTDNNLRNYGPYQAALKDDWEGLKSFFEPKDLDKKQGPAAAALSTPLTAAGDTAFHLAVFSQREEPLKSFLSIGQRNPMTTFDFSIKNDYGNTALHEAAANGNIEAVTLLVNHINGLSFGDEEYLSSEALEDKNNEGETPLFRAAAYGRTKVVKFLAPKSSEDGKLKDSIHRKTLIRKEPKPDASNPPVASREIKEVVNEDNSAVANQGEIIEVLDASILHIAIQGQHFETALELLKLDESLATMKDMKGRASLHLLATIPSAFKSGYRMGAWINRVFYFCLPIDDRIDEEKGSCLNLGKGLRFGDNEEDEKTSCLNLFKGWPILGKICEPVREICQEKRKHKLALRLAKSLIAKDPTWIESIAEATQASATDSDEQGKTQVRRAEKDSKSTPLLLATERGIVEIVEEILEIFPELVEDRNHLNQNILHVAIKHRQTEIFDHVKNMKIPMTRLVRVVDTDGYTILHHAAYMEHETTDIHPAGPVYELQEEINWYKRVEKISPSYHTMLRDKKEKKTCEELFKSKHNELLKRAQQWIKDTSQSCSAVAVLVATVVFAAAYTVPGGSNDNGYPVFLNNDFFLVFTVMDVVALACSLTSVVMFLSVLTSPFKYEEFHHTLPRKLTIGFALLFISLTTTMLAFAATLLLIVRLEKPRWTTTLIYTAAFLPVSIFALTQFPMYVAFEVTLLRVCKMIHKRILSKLPKKLCLQVNGTKKKGDQNKPLLPV